ncbi:MAG: Ku protein [Candidatus Aenigmatarchaeota archaeon]|nr:MAG: Ku protein [Candidatus Aenigmarchaeota archaeon]
MSHAIWEGYISIGLVNIPVKIYSAISSSALSFRLLCKKCHTPLKYERYCPKCKKHVRWDETVKGYELTKGEFVVLEDKDFEHVKLESKKKLEIEFFTHEYDIDPLYMNKSYYVLPERGGEKAYLLLKEILQITSKVAVGRVIIKNRERVAMLRPFKQGMLLTTLHYIEDILPIESFPGLNISERVSREELELAKELVRRYTKPFHLEKFRDRYKEALMEIIKKKARGEKIRPVELEIKETKDLMKALKASIQIKKK